MDGLSSSESFALLILRQYAMAASGYRHRKPVPDKNGRNNLKTFQSAVYLLIDSIYIISVKILTFQRESAFISGQIELIAPATSPRSRQESSACPHQKSLAP